MSDQPDQLRRIEWSQAFPFVRLFSTVRLALDFKRMVLALAAVLITYVAGSILDGVWRGAGGGVIQSSHDVALRAVQPTDGTGGGPRNEIEGFASLPRNDFYTWRSAASDARAQLGARTLVEAGRFETTQEARRQLDDSTLDKLLVDTAYRDELAAVRDLVEEHAAARLEAIGESETYTAALRAEMRQKIHAAADNLRRVLSSDIGHNGWISPNFAAAADVLIPIKAGSSAAASQAADRQRVLEVAKLQLLRRHYEQTAPTGPFLTLTIYESRCFAAAVQAVAAGRWGFGDGAFGSKPALASSVGSAFMGIIWLIVYHPFFALLLTVILLVIFAYFGGAICRSAAVQSAREESISLGETLRFVGDKYGGFIVAPLMPVIVFVLITILLFIGGLVGAIPGIGEIITAVLYPLGLVGGFALAMVFLALLLGFHLMWPTIAAEGSDGFDALSRACSYVGSRAWHVLFYSLTLLIYGGLAFVMMRIIAALTLKLAHSSTKLGMDLVSSGVLATNGKLSALWNMPAWGELPLLPAVGDPPFWGTFHTAPLTGSEMLALFFLRLWVYIVVAGLGAFVVSFFYCGSTQMYFLLRRDVDATDYDEVYYEEEPDEDLLDATPAEDAPAAGADAKEGE